MNWLVLTCTWLVMHQALPTVQTLELMVDIAVYNNRACFHEIGVKYQGIQF